MKRLFTIGSGFFIYSIIPIASWLVLALILGDSRITNVFSLTYAIQFVWSILKYFFASGANIRKEKEQDNNAVWNSIFWGVIFSTIIFCIPIILVDNYISFFGQDVEFYKMFVLYSLMQLYLQILFSLIIEKLYFEDKDKEANIHLIVFNLLNFCVLILSCLFINTTWIALLITILTLLIYVIFLYIKEFQKFKISFNFIKNFKYESANIVSSLFMMLIYLFGFKNAFSAGTEYVLALNFVGLCTDTQWDTMNAISTAAKVDISKKRFQYKKFLKESYIFGICIIFTSIIMFFSLFSFYDIILKIAIIYLILQISDMIFNPYRTIIDVYTQLEYSPTLNTIINLTLKVVRFLISLFLISPYCADIAQLIQGMLTFIVYLIIRFTQYKFLDGKLIVKKNLINNQIPKEEIKKDLENN